MVREATAAVEAVRVHVAPDTSAFDFGAVEVREGAREWFVEVPRHPVPADESGPGSAAPWSLPFRVCKANGEVEISLRL